VSGPRVEESTDYGRDEQGVWVRGPWELIKSSGNVDEVIDQLCPAVMQLPDARGHDDGAEYCGLLYQGMDGMFHASAPSRLPGKVRNGQLRGKFAKAAYKTCSMPVAVKDPGGTRGIDADFHSHPWPSSPMTSEGDTGAPFQRYSIRIQFDTACHVLKFVPHVHEPVPAEIYERVGKSWRLVRVIPVYNKGSGIIDPPFEVP